MSDLDELLAREWLDREGTAAGLATGADPLVARLGVRIRRRRVRRRVLQGAVVVPVVAALAVGGWALAGELLRPVPVVTQSPEPTSTPAPAPTSTATPTPTSSATSTQAALVPLPSEPGLPDRLAAPADVLDRVGPGWVLALYTPARVSDDPTVPSFTAVLLTAPDGSLYELRRLPVEPQADGAWRTTELLDWQPEAGTALVARPDVRWVEDLGWGYGGTATLATLDLTTGATTPVAGGAAVPWTSHLRVAGGGHAWSSSDATTTDVTVLAADGDLRTYQVPDSTQPAMVSPAGDRVLVGSHVLDLTTGAVGVVPGVEPVDGCTAFSWWTASSVLVACPDDSGARLEVRGLDGSQATLGVIPAGAASPLVSGAFPGQWLGDGHVLVAGVAAGHQDVCDASGVVLEITGRTPEGQAPTLSVAVLPSADPRGVVHVRPNLSGRWFAYDTNPASCGDGSMSSTVTVVDLERGEARLAVPLPAGLRPDDFVNGGLSGWALGR